MYSVHSCADCDNIVFGFRRYCKEHLREVPPTTYTINKSNEFIDNAYLPNYETDKINECLSCGNKYIAYPNHEMGQCKLCSVLKPDAREIQSSDDLLVIKYQDYYKVRQAYENQILEDFKKYLADQNFITQTFVYRVKIITRTYSRDGEGEEHETHPEFRLLENSEEVFTFDDDTIPQMYLEGPIEQNHKYFDGNVENNVVTKYYNRTEEIRIEPTPFAQTRNLDLKVYEKAREMFKHDDQNLLSWIDKEKFVAFCQNYQNYWAHDTYLLWLINGMKND